MIQTEFAFTLPVGYQDEEGNLHRDGVMRLATAADEVLPLKDPRVQANLAYLGVVVLSRVVTRLGSVPQINPRMIEGLFAADFAYLQDFYDNINQLERRSHCGCCLQGRSFNGRSESKEKSKRRKKG
jgi:hypothetical protein